MWSPPSPSRPPNRPSGGDFTFPMEFNPLRNTWQLTRQTADLLLQLGQATDCHAAPLSTPACGSGGWSSTCCSVTCDRSSRSARPSGRWSPNCSAGSPCRRPRPARRTCTAAPVSAWPSCRPIAPTSWMCSTPPNGWSPRVRKWSCCPPGADCGAAATTIELSRLRRNGVGVTAPGANLRALIKKAVCPRMLCCGRTASPTTFQPRWMVSHARGSVQHCCSRSASTVRDNWVTVAT